MPGWWAIPAASNSPRLILDRIGIHAREVFITELGTEKDLLGSQDPK